MNKKIKKLIEEFKKENRINKKNDGEDIRLKILYGILDYEKKLRQERLELERKNKMGEF